MSELKVDVVVPRADIRAQVAVPDGATLAVLGPNGSGKSSLLGAIAGTVPATGSVRLGGTELIDRPTHERRIGLLGQRSLLFPHLSVLDNVAFGPRSVTGRSRGNALGSRSAAGRSRGNAREIAGEWLERLEASHWASRRPDQLSGGQAQRVALARALAAEPEVMLLDEPFAAIDVDAVDGLRDLVRRVVQTTCIIVTHDLPDALTLADEVVVLESGRVVESGATTEVLSRPRSLFGARLAGVNLVAGTLGRDRLEVGSTAILGRSEGDATGSGVAVFPPRAVALFPARPEGSPRNTWPIQVETIRADGSGVIITGSHADLGRVSAEVTPSAVAELDLRVGATVWFTIKAQEVELLPRPDHPHRA